MIAKLIVWAADRQRRSSGRGGAGELCVMGIATNQGFTRAPADEAFQRGEIDIQFSTVAPT
jgi:acetyl/propionyl-CoA carboxylase alpha subunit